MSRALIDTDIMLEILKGRNQNVLRRAQDYTTRYARYAISQITLMELAHGFYKREGSTQSVEAIVAQCEVIPLTNEAAILAGEIAARLEGAGVGIGFADTLIAAIAITYSGALATANEKHFQRITHLGYPLTIENWRSA